MNLYQNESSPQKTDIAAIILGCVLITVVSAFSYIIVKKRSQEREKEVAPIVEPVSSGACNRIRENTITNISQTLLALDENQTVCAYDFVNKVWFVPDIKDEPIVSKPPSTP